MTGEPSGADALLSLKRCFEGETIETLIRGFVFILGSRQSIGAEKIGAENLSFPGIDGAEESLGGIFGARNLREWESLGLGLIHHKSV